MDIVAVRLRPRHRISMGRSRGLSGRASIARCLEEDILDLVIGSNEFGNRCSNKL